MNGVNTAKWIAVATLIVASAAVPGAADNGVADARYQAWREAVRARGVDPNVAVYPFAVTPEMRRWARERLGAAPIDDVAKLDALQEALFDSDGFHFEYDAHITLTADGAFAQRRGNCMAFTALFIGLARALDVPVSLVSVQRTPAIERDEDLVFVNRHVVAGYRAPNSWHLYDFYTTSSTPYVRQQAVDDAEASAMFHVNLAGAALRDNALDDAFRNLQVAIELSPEWAPAWVNLGVAHFRAGDSDAAFDAYSHALTLEPGNSSALTNLAVVYRSRGQLAEARAALAASVRTTRNPFTLIALADMELAQDRPNLAMSHLKRARWWFPDEPEVYDAMARVERAMGQDMEAHRLSLKAAALRERSED